MRVSTCSCKKTRGGEGQRGEKRKENSHGVTELVIRVTRLQAEYSSSHEVVPLNDLLVSSTRAGGSSSRRVGAESVREDETSEGVSTLISSVRVLHNVDEGVSRAYVGDTRLRDAPSLLRNRWGQC